MIILLTPKADSTTTLVNQAGTPPFSANLDPSTRAHSTSYRTNYSSKPFPDSADASTATTVTGASSASKLHC